MKNNLYKKVSIGPYTSFSKSSSLYMLCFFIALCPQLVMLFVTKSYASLAIILFAILGALCSQARNFMQKERIVFSVFYSLLTGTLIGFFLPSTYPPVAVFFITLIFMSVSKSFFGAQGVSWVNPVALTVAAAWFIGHFNFPDFTILGEDLALKNPSLNLIQNSFLANPYDEKITAFLNDSAFSVFGVSIPGGYVSLFWDSLSQIPAFRFSALTLLASLFLIALDFEGGLVPLVYLLVYSILVKFVSPVFTGGVMFSGDLLLALLSSGTLFTAFFLLQWHGTMPYTKTGKIVYAVCGGIIAFVFCGTGTSPIGSIITILFLNFLTPLLELYEDRASKNKISMLLSKETAQ